jgi:hypothetical protein
LLTSKRDGEGKNGANETSDQELSHGTPHDFLRRKASYSH